MTPTPGRGKYSLEKFKKALQCSPAEPALDDFYGTLSLMLLSPPTKEFIELIAAWAESGCANAGSDWSECRRKVAAFKAGQYPKNFQVHPSIVERETFQLVRIIEGELHHDWPWGIDRINPRNGLTRMVDLLTMVLNTVSDIKDSVFLFGGEHPMVPWAFPIAHFSMVGIFAIRFTPSVLLQSLRTQFLGRVIGWWHE
jgi:hypothetical protein